MLKSMTGFGLGCAKTGDVSVRVELSSVNRKQLDVSLRLPTALAGQEAAFQKIVKDTVSRGRVTGSVTVEALAGCGGPVLDMDRAKATVKQLRVAAKELTLEDDLSTSDLLHIPGLLDFQMLEKWDDAGSAGFHPLEKALRAALKTLDSMRSREGKALEADFRERLKTLEAILAEIRRLAPQVVSKVRKKLFRGMEAAFAEVLSDKVGRLENIENDERILREIALVGEKADISEEITRLKSHIQQFRKLMRSPEPAGRPLDFLAQELFREINTIGSKAGTLQIIEQVVAFKAEMERVREQIQNVE